MWGLSVSVLLLLAGLVGLPVLFVLADEPDFPVLYDVTDEEFYSMPALFELDPQAACFAERGLYCLGSFELVPPAQGAPPAAQRLYRLIQGYSADWVDHFDHRRLHRGVCVSRRCPRPAPDPDPRPDPESWFAACVNASIVREYELSARPVRGEYCRRGWPPSPPASRSERALAGLAAALVALAALSSALDLLLPPHARKGAPWALAWSVRGCWRELVSQPARTDLSVCDGLRLTCMMCVIIEHVCYLASTTYIADTRPYELMRRDGDGMLVTNSTAVVQVFFLLSSFLLAHKLLGRARREGRAPPPLRTFCRTMLDRIVRISPSYWTAVWFAASWWRRGGGGPMWTPLVDAEADVCRRKWWTHLLYVNNVAYPDDKCLIQTWYLAADMQLYAASLALTLALSRARLAAPYVLAALLLASWALLFALAYARSLVPTFVVHSPEAVRAQYAGEASFNALYQSPLGNLPGALTGLLLAHLHHRLLDARVSLDSRRAFRWASVCSAPLAVWWAAATPALVWRAALPDDALRSRAPRRLPAALLAALDRPVFALLVAVALLGALHGVRSPWRSVLSWRGWRSGARLSFGALLLHMPLHKALVAARPLPTHFDRQTAIFEWFSVAAISYLAALPLALLVELPALRLYRALSAPPTPPAPGAPPAPPAPPDLVHAHDKTEL